MPRPKQQELPFKSWGGARLGAGRKPNGERAGVSHRERNALASRFPVHVTVKLKRGLPRLRCKRTDAVLRGTFAAGSERFGFRLVQYSVQNDHMHFVVEGKDRRALSRGMQGLMIRIAKALNRLWRRRGTVFADRYHDRILRTPREVRNVLRYVLQNALRHWRQRYGPRAGGRIKPWLDPHASGWWFDGWKERFRLKGLGGIVRPVAAARTWLLTEGWRRHGLISLTEVPGGI